MSETTKTSPASDPQWPAKWGRDGAKKPVIIRFEPMIPAGIGLLCLGFAAFSVASAVLGNEPAGNNDVWIAITTMGGLSLLAIALMAGRPRLVITQAGIHLPFARSFHPWSEVKGIYAGRDQFNLTKSTVHVRGMPRQPEPSLVLDVKVPDGAPLPQAPIAVSFAPDQERTNYRHYIRLSGSRYSPETVIEAVNRQRHGRI